MLRLPIISLLLLGYLEAAWPARAGETAGMEEASLGFAESLFEQRDFYRAITEYKRFLFRHPDFPRARWVHFRIGQSYLEGSQLDAARAAFDDLLDQTQDPLLRDYINLSIARVHYLQGRSKHADLVLDQLLPKLEDPTLRGYGLYLRACLRLKTGQPELFRASLEEIWAGHPLAPRASWLALRAPEVSGLPRKSPVLAGVLSILPGLGHLYLGEYSVAVTALSWNGLFGFAVFDAFRRGHHGVGTLLAAMELLWYSGTIYGAVSGAHRYNRDARLNFLEELSAGAGLDIPFPDPKAVGAILLGGEF